LQRLYGELERREDLAYALSLRLSQEGQSAQGLEAAVQLARLRKELGENSAALQLYQQILTADPRHAGARGALEAWTAVPEAGGGCASGSGSGAGGGGGTPAANRSARGADRVRPRRREGPARSGDAGDLRARHAPAGSGLPVGLQGVRRQHRSRSGQAGDGAA